MNILFPKLRECEIRKCLIYIVCYFHEYQIKYLSKILKCYTIAILERYFY